MTAEEIAHGTALIFAIDQSASRIAAQLIQLIGREMNCADCLLVGGTGEALRLVYRHDPPLIFVCVGFESLDQAAALIISMRSRRPELPQLAIAAEHEEPIERAVRAAGAGYYFALDSQADCLLLRQTLDALGFESSTPENHSGLPPPGNPRFTRTTKT